MKMKIEDYLMLKKAGYSDEEISAYNQTKIDEIVVSEPEIKPEPIKEEPIKEEPQPVTNTNDAMIGSLLDEVKSLRGQMEKYFIMHDSVNVNPSNEDIAQKILASVINPTKK